MGADMQKTLDLLIRLIQSLTQENALLIVSVLALLVAGFALYVVLATVPKGGHR
jgi:hypothetical protein